MKTWAVIDKYGLHFVCHVRFNDMSFIIEGFTRCEVVDGAMEWLELQAGLIGRQ